MLFRRNSRKQDEIPKTGAPSKNENKLHYLVGNVQGIGKRDYQEDAFTSINALDPVAAERSGMLFTVCDGMGGMQDGRTASNTAITAISESFLKMNMREDIPSQLMSDVYDAGSAVLSQLGGDGGSTCVAVVIYDEKLYFASVGDSYLYILRNRKLFRLNRSHNVRNLEYLETICKGSVDPSAADANNEKEALTQFLGMQGLDEIDGNKRPLFLQAGDTILICSDGVAGFLNEKILEESLLHGTPMEMCSCLEREIKNKNDPCQDNFTAIVVQCRK